MGQWVVGGWAVSAGLHTWKCRPERRVGGGGVVWGAEHALEPIKYFRNTWKCRAYGAVRAVCAVAEHWEQWGVWRGRCELE